MRTANWSRTAFQIRSAIDVVTEVNFDHMLNWPALDVLVDAFDGFYQQISPAVDIADRIDPRICQASRRQGNTSWQDAMAAWSAIFDHGTGLRSIARHRDLPRVKPFQKKIRPIRTMITIQAITFAMMMRFLNLRSGGVGLLQRWGTGVFSGHRFLPGKIFRDEQIVSCGRFDLLALRGHGRLVTR